MLELNLAPHCEKLADPAAADYAKLKEALGNEPLFHQWKTYQAKDAHITVNCYNTGTGKTKAALLRLLDLSEDFKKDRYNSNVLMIAPTNELLRQHEQDVDRFLKKNELPHKVIRLDAATIRLLARLHLDEKFIRQADKFHQLLANPRLFLKNENNELLEGFHPYVFIINPDLFYYAFYMLVNSHDQKVLFRAFIQNFAYIIIDEFHYYNAKQLANFLFFLTLLREFGLFKSANRRVCLLTATPADQVKDYLKNLTQDPAHNLKIEYIEPGGEPEHLKSIPALAPVRLRLYSTEALGQGLVSLATQEQPTIKAWLEQGRHGVFISSALWRINQLYQFYGGAANSSIGRLTGAEKSDARQRSNLCDLLMATPTVDIGYNFEREGKTRQNIDFNLFDCTSSDEFIQRLGRAARILGKDEHDKVSEVWAVVPDKLVAGLQDLAGQTVERSELNKRVKEMLPVKNGIFAYIRSGAIAEAFLPLYLYQNSLAKAERERAEELYEALCKVYDQAKCSSFQKLKVNTIRYLKLKGNINKLLKEAESKKFSFGAASLLARTLHEQPAGADNWSELDRINEQNAKPYEKALLRQGRATEAEEKRQAEIEEYYATAARFNFRDSFQPTLALVRDPDRLLSSDELNGYSALHVMENFEADWYTEPPQWAQAYDQQANQSFEVFCQINQHREQRLNLYFKLICANLSRQEWEETYTGKLVATKGFKLHSDKGPVQSELNVFFEQQYFPFYAVPYDGPQARALNSLSRITSLYTRPLKIDFVGESEAQYLVAVGSAALLIEYEPNLRRASYAAQRSAAKDNSIFDWE